MKVKEREREEKLKGLSTTYDKVKAYPTPLKHIGGNLINENLSKLVLNSLKCIVKFIS